MGKKILLGNNTFFREIITAIYLFFKSSFRIDQNQQYY